MASVDFVSMDPTHLTQEELDHELYVRGIDLSLMGTTEDRIRLLILHRGDPPSKNNVDNLDPLIELSLLTIKVLEIRTLYEEWKGTTNLSARLATLFCHCVLRIRRTIFRGANFGIHSQFLKLADQIIKLHRPLEEMYQLRFPILHLPAESDESELDEGMRGLHFSEGSKRSVETPEKLTKVEKTSKKKPQGKKKKVLDSTSDSSSDSTASSESTSTDSNSTKSTSRSSWRSKKHKKHKKKKRKHHHRTQRNWVNPLSRWTCKFERGDDLHTFLDNVQEAKDVHDVSEKDLLKGFGLLLEEPAQTWYRINKGEIRSWSHLKKEMALAFNPTEDDDAVLDKIRKLQQHSDETFVVFEARANGLFSRLSRPLDETEKVRKLMNGLDLYYRQQIKQADVTTLKRLRAECKRIEPDKAHIMKLEKDSRRKEEKHKEKTERYKAQKVSAVVPQEGSDSSAGEMIETDASKVAGFPGNSMCFKCWRCGKIGHFSHQCTESIHCINCGQKDTIVERCSRCSDAQARGLWKSTGNQTGSWTGGSPGLMDQTPPSNPNLATPLTPKPAGQNPNPPKRILQRQDQNSSSSQHRPQQHRGQDGQGTASSKQPKRS